ncbi:MAG: rhomboid family intramembrane serine protease [Deltaproteobacteria bacterium]|nr:rhomboid family intramembrane serine protease [Deltaproteobacteria bacterium]
MAPSSTGELTLGSRLKLIFGFLVLLWTIEIVDTVLLGSSLQHFGLQPRSLDGLVGILTMPFLHGGWDHLASNTFPLAIFGTLVLLRGLERFLVVSAIIIVVSGTAVWLVARSSIHIGASGLIFGYLGYLMSIGFWERKLGPVLLSLAIGFLYGGMLWGVLPGQPGVSWEGHLFGFLAGVLSARQVATPNERARTRIPAPSKR